MYISFLTLNRYKNLQKKEIIYFIPKLLHFYGSNLQYSTNVLFLVFRFVSLLTPKYIDMAKQTGLLKVEGTLEDLTFYKSQDGLLVRTKGGVSKKRIMNDPAFARTRENGAEFGHSASAGRMLRVAAGQLVFKVKDRRLSSRLVKVMSDLKNLDGTSKRGERNVALGLTTVEGKQLLKGFDFNSKAPLSSVFYGTQTVDVVTGAVTIAPFVPDTQLRIPEGTTHFSLMSAFLNLDFVTGISAISYSTEENFAYGITPVSTVLTPLEVPVGSGTQFYLLLIEFFQEVNSIQYPLNNGAYNVLQILDVA